MALSDKQQQDLYDKVMGFPGGWFSRGMFGDADVAAGGVDDTVGMLLNTDGNVWNIVQIIGALLGVVADVEAINDAAEGRFPEGGYVDNDPWLKARATEFAKKLQPLCGLLKAEALQAKKA